MNERASAGDLLRSVRERAGLSLQQMARLTNYSRSYLCNLERGRNTVSERHIAVYLRAAREVVTQVNADASMLMPWVLPPDFDSVPVELRQPIEAALRTLVQHLMGRGAGGPDDEHAA